MKKVLILAHDFSPYISIAAQRPLSWLNYFAEHNLFPIVVTRHWNEDANKPDNFIKPTVVQKITESKQKHGTIIRTPIKPSINELFQLKYANKFRFVQKFLALKVLILKFIFPKYDKLYPMYKAAIQVCQQQKIDAVIATGEPFILFKYAANISKLKSIPFIADYRDGWTTHRATLSQSVFYKIIAKYYFKFLEKKYIKQAYFLTTAAPSYQKDLQQLFPNKKIFTILNGYNEFDIDLDKIYNTPMQKEYLEIAYVGVLYQHQRIDTFCKGLIDFILENSPKLKVVFYGLNFFPEQKQQILNLLKGFEDYVRFTDKLPYNQLIEALAKAHICLLLSDWNMNWLNAKVFDYLLVNRKIMLVKNDNGILKDIINETNSGIICNNSSEIKSQLKKAYIEFMQTGIVKNNTQNKEKYSRKNQAKLFSEIILKNL